MFSDITNQTSAAKPNASKTTGINQRVDQASTMTSETPPAYQSTESQDEGLYELRKYFHNANWTPESRDAYIKWVTDDFAPLAKGAGWDITSFWVKPADGSHDTRTSGPALFTQGEKTTGHETSSDTFPTAVWMVRWDSKQQRDEAFAGLLGSPEGQASLSRNPFNTEGKTDLAGYEVIEEHFLENQLFGGKTRPNIVNRSLKGVHEIRTYYLTNEKFDRLRSDEKTDCGYLDWAEALFKALQETPDFKDRITCLFVDNSAKDPELAGHRNYTSGPHVLDPENNPAPDAPALRPKVFWSIHWDSKEQCDEAWGRAFQSDLMQEYFKPGYNPFNETGTMDDYQKMEFQWMESLV